MPVKTNDHDKTGIVVLIPAKVLHFIRDFDNEISAIIHSCLQISKKICIDISVAAEIQRKPELL